MVDGGPRLGTAFWINRTAWPALRDAALAAEAAGWDSIWFDDHLLCDEGDDLDPKLEGWTALAAVAALTTRVRLGHLVTAVTFRNVGLIAKMATTLDHVSGGRFVLGLGAGWHAREHEAFGIDFGSGFGERLDRLDEAAGLLRRLLDGEVVTHQGRFYDLDRAACMPRPVQAHLPILIGGTGRTRTLRTVARVADVWNANATPEQLLELEPVLAEHGAAVGRDVRGIQRQVYVNVVVRSSAAAARRAWDRVRAVHGIQPDERSLHAAGSPGEVAAALRPWVAAGIDEIIAVLRSPWDHETIERLPEVRAALGAPG
jgi:alkanesulfonate monooxygenase SsuD/methylene tetrahydromethanopterin reductase-like flavin-dependent oxidoreductase (luciferase family)